MSERSEIGGRFSLFLEASPVKLRSDFNKDREDRVEYICSNSGVINAYFCGFTAFYPEENRSVYMPIEKLRIYVMYDLLVRVLRNSGYEVNHVMNITDVATSKWQESQDSKVLEKEFFLLFSALSLEEPSVICRASEHISDMVLLIDELTSKGYTYVYDNNLYFSTSSFESKDVPLPTMVKESSFLGKRDNRDFVLWFGNSNKYPNPRYDKVYPSPKGIVGEGFPGWHIECSVMALKYCGRHLNIHGGSSEHKSMHHAAEALQSEAFLGERWVDNWFHISSLRFLEEGKGQIDLSRVIEAGYTANDLKYFFLLGKYNQRIKFSWNKLKEAAEEYEFLREKVLSLEGNSSIVEYKDLKSFSSSIDEFDRSIRNDLDTPRALKIFKDFINSDISPRCKEIFSEHVEKTIGIKILSYKQGEKVLSL